MTALSLAQLTEAEIAALVRAFYGKVRADAMLGPVFATVVGTTDDDWREHLATLTDFWSSVMLSSGRYKGNPLAKHRALAALKQWHFPRWLALFRIACAECFTPELAAAFVGKAERIAQSLEIGVMLDREGLGGLRRGR
ncbi:MAG: group III truncated hemoglobin [Sphingomonas sp.]|uniref:group III truncated hemoglobin n=1 Tax=Sphingomonas sp. TaxID=28214 RepID=UPI003F30828B